MSPSDSQSGAPPDSGLPALCGIAAYYRIVANPAQIRRELALDDEAVTPEDIVRAANLVGLKARIVANPTQRTARRAALAGSSADGLRRL